MPEPRPDFVKNARAILSLTQRELARILGIDRRTILRYEKGFPLPERTHLAIQQLLSGRSAKRRTRKAASS